MNYKVELLVDGKKIVETIPQSLLRKYQNMKGIKVISSQVVKDKK